MKKQDKYRSGYELSRRETLRLIGAGGLTALVNWKTSPVAFGAARTLATTNPVAGLLNTALFAPAARPTWDLSQTSCIARPAQTEGPFFVDELLNRTDIRSDPSNNTVKPGTPLKLKFNVGKISGSACTPLAGAFFDIWHTDAAGGYSDVNGQGNPNNLGQKFCRGYQITDSSGATAFTTIYPGWYSGRTVHIHFKVRLMAGATRSFDFTSQVFFDDTLTDQVFTAAPYNARPNRNTRNSNDGIYQGGGAQLLLDLTADGAGGYAAANFNIGLSNVPDGLAGIAAVSAASFTGTLAPEGIAALFGTGLANGTVAATTAALPTDLGGVQVSVLDAAGTRRNAPLFFVSPTQVNFQIPASTSAGTAVATVLRSGSAVGQGALNIETTAPGLFSANASGQGIAAAVVLRVKADNSQSFEPVAQFNNATSRFEAVPIDLGAAADQVFLVGFGTGLRNRSSLANVTATIGGAAADVSFAGAQGSLTGVDQINLRIPRTLAGRGNADVVLRVDGKTANTVTVNIK